MFKAIYIYLQVYVCQVLIFKLCRLTNKVCVSHIFMYLFKFPLDTLIKVHNFAYYTLQ